MRVWVFTIASGDAFNLKWLMVVLLADFTPQKIYKLNPPRLPIEKNDVQPIEGQRQTTESLLWRFPSGLAVKLNPEHEWAAFLNGTIKSLRLHWPNHHDDEDEDEDQQPQQHRRNGVNYANIPQKKNFPDLWPTTEIHFILRRFGGVVHLAELW